MTDQFQWWRDAIAGNNPPVHDGEVQAGFFRTTLKKGGRLIPVAIWFDDSGNLMNQIGYSAETGREPYIFSMAAGKIRDRWTFICKNPIPHADFIQARDTGNNWPDEAAAPEQDMRGHNNPPATKAEQFASDIELLSQAVKDHGKIPEDERDQAWADKLANFKSLLGAKWKEVDEVRKAEKKPHDDAGKEVQQTYKPLLDDLKKWGDSCRRGIEAFATAQAEASERELREKMEEVAKGDATVDEAMAAAQAAPTTKFGGRSAGGTVGRATSLKEVRVAEITDWVKCIQHYMDLPAVKVAVQAAANKDAQNEDEGPGWKVRKEQRAS